MKEYRQDVIYLAMKKLERKDHTLAKVRELCQTDEEFLPREDELDRLLKKKNGKRNLQRRLCHGVRLYLF